MDDLELIAALRRQDDGSAELLLDQYGNEIYSLIYKMTQSEELSKTLTVQTFKTFGKQRFDFDLKTYSIYSFLVATARKIVASSEIEGHGIIDLDQNLSKHDLINSNYTQIIDHLFLRGRTLEDISKKLRVPVSTGRTRFRLAINALKKKYHADTGGFVTLWVITSIMSL